jgi:hypothetical protein
MIKVFQYTAVLLLLLLVALAYARSQNALYRLVRRIKLGGHPLWEFMAVDAFRRRLLLSQDLRLLVIDMDKDETAGAVDFPVAVYGIALAGPLNKGFVGHRAGNAISVFDLQTLQITGRIEGIGPQPESLLYDEYSGRLFAWNGRGRELTVIDAIQNTVGAIIPLPAPPALIACDGKGNLFVLPVNTDELLQIDTTTGVIIKHWTPVAGEAPGGLAFDNDNNLLFCAFDGRVIVVDAIHLTEVAVVPVGSHPGTVIFDTAESLLYVANGEGNMTIIKQLKRDEYKPVQTVATQAGCRSMAADPLTKKLYLPAMKYLSPRKPAPGSFELLVFAFRGH